MKLEADEIIGYEQTYFLMVRCPNEDCHEGVYLGSNYCPRCGVGLKYEKINKKVREELGVGDKNYEI